MTKVGISVIAVAALVWLAPVGAHANENKEKLKDLIRTALNDFWEEGVSVVIATCGEKMLENRLLHQTGFFSIPNSFKPEPLYFIVNTFNSNNENAKKLTNLENWFFSFGDYDAF